MHRRRHPSTIGLPSPTEWTTGVGATKTSMEEPRPSWYSKEQSLTTKSFNAHDEDDDGRNFGKIDQQMY